MRWVGALQVVKATNDTNPIWQDDFPVLFEVKPLVILQPEHGVPMDDLSGKVDFHPGPQDGGKFKGFVRMITPPGARANPSSRPSSACPSRTTKIRWKNRRA